jgi:SET domain-containing protein
MEVPVQQSWLTPLAECRPARSNGLGIHAMEFIAGGTTVAAFGGFVVDRAELDKLDEPSRIHSIQIDDDLFLVSNPPFVPADYVNHSCEPNCGIVGSVLVVTMRDVEAGEELCFDYAMSDTDDYDEFDCNCGMPSCRGVVRGDDWRLPELQEKYAGWFSAYTERRVQRLRKS